MATRLLTSFKDHQNWTIVQHQSQRGKCDWGGSRICTKPSRPWDMGSVGTRKCTKPWCHLQEYTCRLCKVKNFNLEMYNSPLSLFHEDKASHQRNQILYNTYFHKLASRVFLSHQYHRPIIGKEKKEIDCSNYFFQNSTSQRRWGQKRQPGSGNLWAFEALYNIEVSYFPYSIFYNENCYD